MKQLRNETAVKIRRLNFNPARLVRDYLFFAARTFAQRALAAAEIFRRAAALIVHFFRPGFAAEAAEPPARVCSLAESFSICCFKATMRLSLAVDRFNRSVIEFESMPDYSISLALKCANYRAPGGGCNPVTGGAGGAGGNTS